MRCLTRTDGGDSRRRGSWLEEFAADPPEAVVRGLRERLGDSRRPLGRLHALWTLSGLGQLDRESLDAALHDPDPELRRNAVLAFEETLRGDAPAGSRMALAPDVVAMIGEPDPGVRLQAMLTSGLLLRSEVQGETALRDPVMSAVVAGVRSAAAEAPVAAESATGQHWLRLGAVSVLAGDPVRSLEALLTSGVADGEVVERIATLLPAERLGEVMAGDLVLRVLSDSAASPSGTGDALLAGLTAAATGGGGPTVNDSTLAGPLRRLRRSADDVLSAAAWRLSAALGVEASAEEVGLLDCAGVRAANPAVPLEERLQALALFGLRRHWPAASEDIAPRCPEAGSSAGNRAAETVPVEGTWLERVGALLGAEQPRPVQRAAMAELASADEEKVTAYLVERWPYLGPDARRDAGSYLIRGRSRHAALLDALESGRIGLGEMNFILERRRFLLRSPEPEIRRRARALFDDAGVVTRADAIEAMRPALELDGDPERGEVLFLELCARCHRSGGAGGGPGPDLSGIGRKSAETLLHDILDPNAAVDTAYVNYIVETTDGEVHSGLLAESAGGGIVLRAAEDLLIEVPAGRVREVRSDSLSMMPEELEAGLEPADMADLLAFLNR